ncbi:PREDICTED: uncharacterized protein LOC105363592 [Ceratosolen solmsi marchali]|uniref:Uncharacterized protein LOC105363592 n=1 Tax=Ceratosolen solmsi marchali TaxID=326594 RepID=A0AAJ6YKA5_9HYME|nr:PREDICTED: uncharacterized protein LOC105363592 [Ceratosolen solmsi marchali]
MQVSIRACSCPFILHTFARPVCPNNQSKSAPPTCLQPIKRTCIKLRDRPSHSNRSISYLTKYKLQKATNFQRILPIELTASHISISIDHLNAVQQFKSNFFLINQWLIAYNG